MIIDAAGNLYGVTWGGGTGAGGIYKLAPDGTYTVLYTLCPNGYPCADGADPYSLTYAGASSNAPYDGTSPLYGLNSGFTTYGIVFALQNNGNGLWSYNIIHSFCGITDNNCIDGNSPSNLISDANGKLFGITQAGGKYRRGQGLVFSLTAGSGGQWNETSLYDFCREKKCPDGAAPGSLTIGQDGKLYGATLDFGPNCGAIKHLKDCGALFSLDPDGTHYRVLYGFCAQPDCQDGREPSNIIEVQPKHLLGLTAVGGQNDLGTIFEFHNGNLRSLYQFCTGQTQRQNCPGDSYPSGLTLGDATGLTLSVNGTLFGMSRRGGKYGFGEVFELTR
jgi:uncharacterized repeat protein (TIGR03803 family)